MGLPLAKERIMTTPHRTDPGTDPDGALFARGDAVRRAVLGDAHVDRSHAGADPFGQDLQDFITRYAWGAIWAREGLSRRERSIVTLALLAGLVRTEELPLHVRGAVNNGLTPDEIKEILLQTAVYAGVPAAHTAFHIARHVLDTIEAEQAAGEDPSVDAGHA
jgi:4-carboxymuconolactone decarboxylase